MTGGITGRYVPGDSVLHSMDPRAKLFGFLILIVAVIFTDSVPGYILMGTIVIVLAFLSGVKLHVMAGAAKRMLSFFIIIFLMNALFYSSDDPIWSFWFINLSKEGMIQGANVVLRIALIIVMSSILTMTMTAKMAFVRSTGVATKTPTTCSMLSMASKSLTSTQMSMPAEKSSSRLMAIMERSFFLSAFRSRRAAGEIPANSMRSCRRTMRRKLLIPLHRLRFRNP